MYLSAALSASFAIIIFGKLSYELEWHVRDADTMSVNLILIGATMLATCGGYLLGYGIERLMHDTCGNDENVLYVLKENNRQWDSIFKTVFGFDTLEKEQVYEDDEDGAGKSWDGYEMGEGEGEGEGNANGMGNGGGDRESEPVRNGAGEIEEGECY
jgi:hypothetical protein